MGGGPDSRNDRAESGSPAPRSSRSYRQSPATTVFGGQSGRGGARTDGNNTRFSSPEWESNNGCALDRGKPASARSASTSRNHLRLDIRAIRHSSFHTMGPIVRSHAEPGSAGETGGS